MIALLLQYTVALLLRFTVALLLRYGKQQDSVLWHHRIAGSAGAILIVLN